MPEIAPATLPPGPWDGAPLCPQGTERLPREPDAILDAFLAYLDAAGIVAYPAQEEAILAIMQGRNVILNTPTGSGKSLVATALHYKALCQGRRSVYTSPIKALVNEKFLSLCRDFGAAQVGLVTGDATVNRDAPILCCTAEILANLALSRGAEAGVDDVVMDEFHYYGDRDRGVAWQVPLLTLSRARFLLMSATVGETDFFRDRLERLTGAATAVVKGGQRPVPLDYRWLEEGLEQAVEQLAAAGEAPIYLVHFSQRSAAESAGKLLSLNFCSREEKREIGRILGERAFRSPYGKDVRRMLAHGVGLHHAGLLPRYRLLVELLAQRRLLKVICGTDTLGVGINVPIRTVLFTGLSKFDGKSVRILPAREFHQVAGRAGRKGFDDHGLVVALPPPHVIENLKAQRRVAADSARGRKRKLVKKAPPRGMVPWDEKTFRKLIDSAPEALVSSFRVSHGMLLQVLGRVGEDGCSAMRKLVRDSHESDVKKKRHMRRAWQLFRSLVDSGIIELSPPPAGRRSAAERYRLAVDLQEDFSMHQTLSLWLLQTLELLDREADSYALDVLTLVESILEDPVAILARQVERARGDLLARLKNEGMPYEERLLMLEEVEHPKPLREFVYATFGDFRALHPWVEDDNIRPKSIAREMVESCLGFPDYVRRYGLQRAEGVLLRYLSQVCKVLVQTVPETAGNDDVREMEIFLESEVRGIDSSLLDEWQALGQLPEGAAVPGCDAPAARHSALDVTRDEQAFAIRVRNAAFQATRALVQGRYDDLREMLGAEVCPAEDELREMLRGFEQEHGCRPDLGSPACRAASAFLFRDESREEGDAESFVEQVLCTVDGESSSWAIVYRIDLEASRSGQCAVLRLVGARAT